MEFVVGLMLVQRLSVLSLTMSTAIQSVHHLLGLGPQSEGEDAMQGTTSGLLQETQ